MPRERVTRSIRFPPDLLRDIETAAGAADLSVNRWIMQAIEHELHDIEVALTFGATPKRVADAHADRYPVFDSSGQPAGHVVVDAHADRYPHVTVGDPVMPNPMVSYQRPVGSFDPDTDQPA